MIPQVIRPSFQVAKKGSPHARNLSVAWNLTEGRGATAYDSSGHGRNGPIRNSPIWSGQALDMDGVDQDVFLNESVGSIYGTSVTFYTSSEINSSSSSGRLVGFRDDVSSAIYTGGITGLITDEVLTIQDHSSGTVQNTGVTSITIPVGWHNVTCLWSVSLSRYRIFLDYVEQSVVAGTNGHCPLISSLVLALAQDGRSGNFSAYTFSDLKVWDAEMPPAIGKSESSLYTPYFRGKRDRILTPMGEVSATGQIGILSDLNAVATQEFNRVGNIGVRVQMESSITKDFRNVQSLRGAIGIIAELDGVVSAQFTQEREGRIDIVAEFNSPVTFEKMKAGQIDAIVDLVASKSEGATPVTDQDIGEAIIFRAPKIDYVFRANKHPTGRKL